MRKRQGASLLNVVVFMMFAVMIMSQVFFFAKWSIDSAAENREILMYRLHLDSLVEEAKTALRETGGNAIIHNKQLDNTGGKLKFSEFYEGATARYSTSHKWELSTKTDWDAYKDSNGDNVYSLTIHDLSYTFNPAGFSSPTSTAINTWRNEYGNANADKKVFAAMLPDTKEKEVADLDADGNPITDAEGHQQTHTEPRVTARYYLIRALAKLPENYYGRKLMYQVLVRRNEDEDDRGTASFHRVNVLSFQEVWF